jgi:hypothetical protein
MAVFEFWRDITVGSPNDTVNRYRYDTSDDSIAFDSFSTLSGTLGPINPPVGTVMYTVCDDLDLVQYKSTGSSSAINKVTTPDQPQCCQIQASDFSVVRNNNTSLVTPNGKITVTAPVLDINDYEASIDGGDTYVAPTAGEIVFEDLPAGNYSIIIKATAGVCSVTTSTSIVDQISYPPLIIHEETQPSLYSPIFHPITLGYKLDNNAATVKQDLNGAYLEVASQDAKDYLATLPIVKIIDNEDYAGTYQIESVDDTSNPTKFYFNGVYTTEQPILFVPFDRQVFELYCETSFNNYEKIADIAAYPDNTGEYLLRLEGFLQGAFEVNPPVNDGDDITLLRKYYVLPRNFDMETTPTVFNAVYSAIEDLTPYLDDLVPLGPAPINFISEQTQKGLPVLFSYIDTATGRIKNITSSNQTNVIATTPLVLVFGLPLNQYDFQWVNPAGAIASLNVTPALPAWITQLASASDTVKLTINTSTVDGGDYEPDDYDSTDYLTFGVNAIVGCHEFLFKDGVTELFTLRICIFPIQKSEEVCASDENNFNIAWVNRQGGRSSYVFEGKKVFGVDIGKVGTYKKAGELKRSSVEEVYDNAEVTISNKSKRDMIFIASLWQSIQAYLYDPATQQWSIPIILNRENYEKYQHPFRQIEQEGSFSFRYSNETVIQSQ